MNNLINKTLDCNYYTIIFQNLIEHRSPRLPRYTKIQSILEILAICVLFVYTKTPPNPRVFFVFFYVYLVCILFRVYCLLFLLSHNFLKLSLFNRFFFQQMLHQLIHFFFMFFDNLQSHIFSIIQKFTNLPINLFRYFL